MSGCGSSRISNYRAMSVAGVLFIAVCVLCSGYIIRRNRLHVRILFRIGYLLYSRTRLGYYYHRRVLRKCINRAPHSHTKAVEVGSNGDLAVHVVAVLNDNYSYVIVERSSGFGVAVDPCDPNAVQKLLEENQINLQVVMTTHKHWDHAGGNAVLKEMYPNLLIYGSREDGAQSVNRFVADGDRIKVGTMEFTARLTPGHTIGHVVYILNSMERPCLFSGDHLFCGGCGKVFEGNFQTMFQSLEVMKSLNQSTLVFPGHEYTLSNLKFALSIDPNNSCLERKFEDVKALRLRRQTTVPSTIQDELNTNPFLRTDSPVFHKLFKTNDQLAVLKHLRELKDKGQKQ